MKTRSQDTKIQAEADQYYIQCTDLFDNHHFKKALRVIDKAINLKPDNAVYIHMKGIVHANLNEFEKALTYYNKSLEIDPNYINCIGNKANVLTDLKRYEEGLTTINQGIKLIEEGVKVDAETRAYFFQIKAFILKMMAKNEKPIDNKLNVETKIEKSLNDNSNVLSKKTETSTIEKLTEINVLDDMTEIDVPNDDNCLFWATALALLLPVLNDEAEFEKMYGKMFGIENYCLNNGEEIEVNSKDTKDKVKRLLAMYDCKKNTVKNFGDNLLEELVCHVFRNRVVDKMDKTLDAIRKECIVIDTGKSWIRYTDGMREKTGWGGESEIYAISHLVGVNVCVLRSGYSSLLYQIPDTEQTIYLVHTNSKGAGQVNHYHYRLQNNIYLEHHTKQNRNTILSMLFPKQGKKSAQSEEDQMVQVMSLCN